MIVEADFSEKQKELYELMSWISEYCYCAGWMIGSEYIIWEAMHGGPRHYGQDEIRQEDLDKCAALSKALDGWIIWYDDHDQAGLPASEWGQRFVTMDEWNLLLAKS